MAGPLPIPELLSQALVAYTIEFDNEFEHRMPHRTTNHGSTPGHGRAPWLVSMVMWVNCVRFVTDDDGVVVGELARRAHVTDQTMVGMVKRLGRWWGYLTVDGPGPAGRPVHVRSVVRPTPAGSRARRVWEPLDGEIESRWRDRFGQREVDGLRRSLVKIVSELDGGMPDGLYGDPRLQAPEGDLPAVCVPDLTLSALLSKVLMALALDFQDTSDLSLGQYTSGLTSKLPISANVLRVLGEEGVPVGDLTELTGVATMSTDNWLRILERRGYLVVERDRAPRRRKVARLTGRGMDARAIYRRWAAATDERLAALFGASPVRSMLDGRLRLGLEGYPEGWRRAVPLPGTLPHFPVISHRGGFPDGS